MSRTKIEDLSIERTLNQNETDQVIGAGGWAHFGPHGGGLHWGGGHVHWGRRRRRRYPRWHDTTHWDYHPGGFHRHGNHFHYVPGHYHLHRSGHWHY